MADELDSKNGQNRKKEEEKGKLSSSSKAQDSNKGKVRRSETQLQINGINPKVGSLSLKRARWLLIPKILLICKVLIISFNKLSCM